MYTKVVSTMYAETWWKAIAIRYWLNQRQWHMGASSIVVLQMAQDGKPPPKQVNNVFKWISASTSDSFVHHEFLGCLFWGYEPGSTRNRKNPREDISALQAVNQSMSATAFLESVNEDNRFQLNVQCTVCLNVRHSSMDCTLNKQKCTNMDTNQYDA